MGVLATVVEGGAVDDGLYGFLLFLHIVLAIFGFGAVVLNGLYGAEAKKRPGPGGLAEELNSGGPPPEGAQGPPPQVAQMEEIGKKLAAGGAFLNLMLLAIIYLMIFKPGWP